ncbi:GAF domain-containing protein [Pararoseomonas indoligenes]|uniref:GAF domain-containing protein n=1 Tax=Roseomonas indoligenes TaxID=2820811 RepID=A0A940MXG4_9PROT|nr:GAF domain-containing protein [Pararoseomonas indoligenes]MBP0496053.1 GAF domain-containing protein [Pararoseomonas indoligenes]
MSASPYPDQDATRREAALAEYAVMDTPAEPAFDRLVQEAAGFCQTPIAVMSLLDRRRQWFKARVGVDLTETPIEHAVCALASGDEKLLVISDLTKDPRTAGNPLVTGEPRVRFYAGAPIRLADGLRVGSLCVVDTVPRPQGLSSSQGDRMLQLAGRAEVLLDERKGRQAPASPAAPARHAPGHFDEKGLLDLHAHARAQGLSAAEAFFRLTIEALAKRKE